MVEERYMRQEGIVSSEAISNYTPLVIGCGAIGSQVAKQLVQMGSNVILVDFDSVDNVNLCCQGFREKDLGRPKVEALVDVLREMNQEVSVAAHACRYGLQHRDISKAVFCCVDDIELRGNIFRRTMERSECADIFIDGRMKGGDTVRIVQARGGHQESLNHYRTTLFNSEDAEEGSCTTKTTIYGAYVAAGLMVSEYAKFLRGQNLFSRDFMVSLLANEMDDLTVSAE